MITSVGVIDGDGVTTGVGVYVGDGERVTIGVSVSVISGMGVGVGDGSSDSVQPATRRAPIIRATKRQLMDFLILSNLLGFLRKKDHP
jgi:hypothetical protein